MINILKLEHETFEGYTHQIVNNGIVEFVGTFDDCCWYLDYYVEV